MSEAITLHQFPFSHYNEKARWALDWKGVPHVREDWLPGPHARAIRRMTGATTTPVLCIDGRIVAGSARIVEELENRFPDPPLFPTDPDALFSVGQIVERFDEEVGPRVRRVVFSATIDELGYVCRMFAGRKSLPVRVLYRGVLPLVKGRIRKSMGLDDPSLVREAFRSVEETLDFVADKSSATRYLAGDRFTVADLTAAALLMPIVDIDHADVKRPRPMPRRLEEVLEHFAAHPGAAWVREQYRRHRPGRAG